MQATGLPPAVLLRCLQLRRLQPSQTACRVLRAHKRPLQLVLLLLLLLLLHPRLLRRPKPKRTMMIPAAAATHRMTTFLDSRAPGLRPRLRPDHR